MRKNIARVRLAYFFSVAALLVAASGIFAQEPTPWSQNTSPLPAPTGYVNDYAGVFDPAAKQQLEAKLKNFKETTNPSVEIAVAIVKTTGDRAIFDYSLAVARGWKIGSKLDDNPSALLFVAIDDRKYFTQVSKDLEDELSDGTVGGLQRQFLVPEFKKQNYSKGISDTIDAYIAAIKNKGNGNNANTTQTKPAVGVTGGGFSFSGVFCCLIIIIVILVIIFSRRGKGPTNGDRSRWGGSRYDSGTSSSLPWIIGGILGGSSGGSGSSSSGDWGSSSSGSDFGGFSGGGDFGGGGSGGDW